MSRKSIRLVEVALRDGLQNESISVGIMDRVDLAERLVGAGIRRLELGAFVRPDRVPQMAGSADVIRQVLRKFPDQKTYGFSALVPNEVGMIEALKTGVREVALFTAASESFARANINCSIEESFERFEPVLLLARKNRVKVRGYLSTCFGCPYEGKVDEAKVVRLAERLWKMGCYEISIGDTIGVADPHQVRRILTKLLRKLPAKALAGHFHDTRGTAVANVLVAYEMGLRTFDSSLGGLGGCPYAPGAAGNVATEDLVYLFERMGVETGVDLSELVRINRWFAEIMDKKLASKVGQAGVFVPQALKR